MFLFVCSISWVIIALSYCSAFHNKDVNKICNKLCIKTSKCIKEAIEENKFICNNTDGESQVKCLIFCEKSGGQTMDDSEALDQQIHYTVNSNLNKNHFEQYQNKENKVCNKICIKSSQCKKSKFYNNTKFHCKDRISKEKCFSKCDKNESTPYGQNGNLINGEEMILINNFLNDDNFAEDINSIMHSDLFANEIEDYGDESASNYKRKNLIRVKREMSGKKTKHLTITISIGDSKSNKKAQKKHKNNKTHITNPSPISETPNITGDEENDNPQIVATMPPPRYKPWSPNKPVGTEVYNTNNIPILPPEYQPYPGVYQNVSADNRNYNPGVYQNVSADNRNYNPGVYQNVSADNRNYNPPIHNGPTNSLGDNIGGLFKKFVGNTTKETKVNKTNSEKDNGENINIGESIKDILNAIVRSTTKEETGDNESHNKKAKVQTFSKVGTVGGMIRGGITLLPSGKVNTFWQSQSYDSNNGNGDERSNS
ncbi:hypothetical protein O3M35_006723 [Rhynocoris fuscipes]|uniref:Uncharacterized protein n=1 Tax=Rhynocoris fuscipes TaxID=488301 RepID=A0AAW1DFA6_9HEMI